MRHDELLAELTDTEQVYARETLYAALRAVVELHKPELIESGEESIFVCSTCNPEWFWENPYPCPTIQAIEKELG